MVHSVFHTTPCLPCAHFGYTTIHTPFPYQPLSYLYLFYDSPHLCLHPPVPLPILIRNTPKPTNTNTTLHPLLLLRLLPLGNQHKMSADPPQTTHTPKSTYSFRMTPARLTRLTQNNPPPTSTKRKTRNTQSTQSPHNTSVRRPRHIVQSPSSSTTPSTTRSTSTNRIPQSSPEETVTLTRFRQPSRFTTSISAIPRLTSQFLSALAGPLIIPRNFTTDFLRTLLRDTSSSATPPTSFYTSTPSTSLTQTSSSPLNILPLPLTPPHNISTTLDSLLSYILNISSTHPLFPFRYFSTTTPESTQTDSYYLCPTCEWQPLSYPLTQDAVNLQGLLLTRIQSYLGGIPDIIREYCGLHALRTTAHLLKILPTLIVYPLLPVILACIESPHRDTIPHGQFPTSLLHSLLLLQNTLVATFRLYLMSALFIPLSYFTPQRQFTHVLFRILHCIREATLHLFHEIPTIVPRYYTIPSLTLFCTITQFGDLIITRETQLLSTHLEQYYSAISSQPIPHSSCHSQSSDNLSPPLSPTTLHRLFTPSALSHHPTLFAEQIYNAYYDPAKTRSLTNLEQYLFFAHTAYTNTASLHPSTIPYSFSPPSPLHLHHPSPPTTCYPPTPASHSESRTNFTPNHLSSTMAPPTNSPSQRGHTVDRATQSTTSRSNPIISPRSVSHQENTSHSHDNMTHAIATAMDHLWQTRIQPSLEQQRDENRQCYEDIQIQLDSVRRSVTDSVRPLPSTSRSSALHHPTSTQFSPHHSPILSSLRDNESPTTIRTSRIRWEDNTIPPPPSRDPAPSFTPPPLQTSSHQRNQRSVDLTAFLTGTRNPLLTEDDLERFARKQPEKLTDYQIRAFADQLERYLSSDPENHEFLAESAALRKLIQSTKPSLLGAWLQLYTNSTVQFSYCKTLFWRRKYDENAHRCIPRPHRGPDIPECLERLTRTIEDHFQPTNRPQGNGNPPQRPPNNNNYRPNNQRPYDNNQNRNFQPQYTQNYQPRNDNNRNNGNQQNYNRNNNQNYSSNRQPYQQQQQYSNQQPRQQYDNRQNNNSNQQSFRPNNQQNAPQNQQQNRPQQQQNQRPNNYDNRNNSSRNSDPRQQNSDRRNNQYQHNNVDEIQQDFYDITSNEDLPSYDTSDYDSSQYDNQDAPCDIDPNQQADFR